MYIKINNKFISKKVRTVNLKSLNRIVLKFLFYQCFQYYWSIFLLTVLYVYYTENKKKSKKY